MRGRPLLADAHARSLMLTDRRIERLARVDTLVVLALIVRNAHGHDTAAAPAAAVRGGEVDAVDPAVAGAGALGAQRRRGRTDAEGVGAGVAVARVLRRLILG